MADLNKCYLTNNAFYQRDIRQDGFEWVDCHQEQKCMYLFERISGDQKILAVFNFSDETQDTPWKRITPDMSFSLPATW